jgi:hypothetical protein
MIQSIKYFFLFLVLIVGINSCSTDFELTSDWKDITVVYTLLNSADTAHYVKINKAFLDEDANSLVQAQIPDSNFYQSLIVRMEEYNDAEQLLSTFDLIKVDGNLEGLTKDDGIFPQTPNWLYKTKNILNAARHYKLIITKSEGAQITAVAEIVDPINVVKPSALTPITMYPSGNQTYQVNWKATKDASFYSLNIKFYYKEYPTSNPDDSVTKFINWDVFNDYVPANNDAGTTLDYRFNTNEFYRILSTDLQVLPNYTRESKYFEFTFGAGGKELYTYYLVNKAKNGITSGQISPEYTNISEGLGIFSSRTFNKISKIPLKVNTIDSIACNSITKDLNFLNSLGNPCQ